MSRPSPAAVDPGLQPERTDHAWRRTAFSFLVVGSLMLHTADGMSHVLGLIIAVPVVAFSFWVYRTGFGRYRHATGVVRKRGVKGRVVGPRNILIVTAAVMAMQLLALLMEINSRLHLVSL